MSLGCYIIVDGAPRAVEVEVWARWFDLKNRRVRQFRWGQLNVSTVFLGLDHNFEGEGPPVLWETMVFYGGWGDVYCERYTSRWAAEDGHDFAVVWGLWWVVRESVKNYTKKIISRMRDMIHKNKNSN